MKTNTFEEKLYALADDFSNIEMNARFHNLDWLVHSVKDLVLNDVIGEDVDIPRDLRDFDDTHQIKYWYNAHRAEQRAIIKGGNHED